MLTVKKSNGSQKEKPAQSTLHSALDRVSNDLRAYALHLTKNRSDANDLFQDVALKIYSNRDKFEEIENFKAWAITIMRNNFIKGYHLKNRRREIINQAPSIYFFNSGSIATSNQGELNMAYKDILRLINALPEIYRKPFSMFCEGFKYVEIAEQLNIPLKTIKNRMRLARRKLKISHALLRATG